MCVLHIPTTPLLRHHTMEECPLCLQFYDSGSRCARILPCTHVACTHCLTNLGVTGVLVCPFDRIEHTLIVVASLPVRQSPLVDAQQCELCDEQHPATSYCEDCESRICDLMASAHKKAKGTRDHRVTPLPLQMSASNEKVFGGDQLSGDTNASASACEEVPPTCTEHSLEFTDFDTQCSVPVCVRCLSLTHHGHKCITLAEAASAAKERADASTSEWERLAEEMRTIEHEGMADMEALEASRAACERDIKARFEELRSVITARELELLDAVSQSHKTRSFALAARVDQAQSIAESLERAVDQTRGVSGKPDVTIVVESAAIEARVKNVMGEVVCEDVVVIQFAMEHDTLHEIIRASGDVVEEITRAAPVKTCPNKHTLAVFTSQGHTACDLCKTQQPSGAQTMSCRPCDFDMCAACAAQNKVAFPPPAESPPTPAAAPKGCPGGHTLSAMRLRSADCDTCKRTCLSEIMTGCRVCNWDICPQCAEKGGITVATVASTPPPPVTTPEAPQQTPKIQTCPNKHGLTVWTSQGHSTCDLCRNRQPSGVRTMACRACNFDMCAHCARMNNVHFPAVVASEPAPPKTAPRVAPQSQSQSQNKVCPSKHPLKLGVSVQNVCDVCSRVCPPASHIMTCSACDYDMCRLCAARNGMVVPRDRKSVV